MWGPLNPARRREAADKARRQRELRHLEFLRDEIFARPDIARMYWHTRHPADIKVLASVDFTTLAGELRQPASQETSAHHPAADLIREFLEGLDADDRRHLIHLLGRVFRGFQRTDLAERLNAYTQDPEDEAYK